MNTKIIVDAFGGDNAPFAVVEGAVMALNEMNDIELILSGKKDIIEAELKKYSYDNARMHILDAADVITMHDSPTLAIKQKKDSSMVKALYAVANGEAECIVSGGNTGALLTGATLIIKRIKGVKRPALAPMLPTLGSGYLMLIDSGANVDCRAEYLQQFAVMATAYMKKVALLLSPRVALLNNGTEESKGNELTKEAYALLKKTESINFMGNCEARDILTGDYDVLVCDGFTGNVVLKNTEGLIGAFMVMLKRELMADTRAKFGAALSKKAFARMKKNLDYKEYGGAPLLGVNGGVIKAHGSSNARAFRSAIVQARELCKQGVNSTIAAEIVQLDNTQEA